MECLKVKILLNKGKRGISISKLSKINTEATNFLPKLCRDLNLDPDPEAWVAVDFAEIHSLEYNYENQTVVDVEAIHRFSQTLLNISNIGIRDDIKFENLRYSTIDAWLGFAKHLEANEAIRFGLYLGDNEDVSKWISLDKGKAKNIRQFLNDDGDIVEYFGAIQGVIRTLNKEDVKNLKFSLRELSTNKSIECFFHENQYDDIIKQLEHRDQVVFVNGNIFESLSEKKVKKIQVRDITPAGKWEENDLQKFIGCDLGNIDFEELDGFLSKKHSFGSDGE